MNNRIYRIFTTYAPDTDITFILEECINNKGDILETTLKGFYYGEPNENNTKDFIGKFIAV
jgi:hypothetical protein